METYGPPFVVARLRWYPLAPVDAAQESVACESPLEAARLAGVASVTSSVVEPVWLIVPLPPVTVSESA